MMPDRFRKPAPAAADVTAVARRAGTRGIKPGTAAALASTANYWDTAAGNAQPPGRYAATQMADDARAQISDAEAREEAAEQTKQSLGLKDADDMSGSLNGNLYRGRMRGTQKKKFDVFGGAGHPGDGLEESKSQKKGKDPRPAESRQGSNASNRKMGRADDVDAPVKGDGSPHFQR